MRFLLPILPFFLAVSAMGQEMERKLQERILRPNQDLTYDTRQSTFGTNKSAPSKAAKSKEFGMQRSFATKEFGAKEFSTKEAWAGKKQFAAKAADTRGHYEMPNVSKASPSKAAPVKEAFDANKAVDTAKYAQSDRPWLGRGRSQDRLDYEKSTPKDSKPLGYTGNLKVMTIDEVRELLNKNK